MWTLLSRLVFGLGLTVFLLATAKAAQPLLDTDGDGSPDAFEYFLRTDPLNAQSVFGVRAITTLQAPARTRLTWFGVEGRPFKVEAARDPAGPWQTVATFQGSGSSINHDIIVDGQNWGYFRLATEFDSTLPPWVGPIDTVAQITTPGVQELYLQAWHPLGLDELIIQSGNQILGGATRLSEYEWQFAWAADSANNGVTSLQAAARAGALVTTSPAVTVDVDIVLPPQPLYLTQNPDQFVLLDSQGNPIANSIVRADANGNLPPCEYRPMGFNPGGDFANLGIRLAGGARISGVAGSEILEFNKSQLVSGPQSVLQVAGDWRSTVHRTLRLGGLSIAELAALYDHPVAEGLPVSLLGQFPARILGGKFSDKGLEAPQFALVPGTLPFGDVLGGFERFVLGLGNNGFITLPLSGSFPLKQAGGPDATITIGPETPSWVRLGFDGSIRLMGKARLAFSSGPQFEIGLNLNDPIFGMEFRAAKLEANAAAWLKNRLPSAQSLTTASPADASTLNSAERLLTTKAQAFERYAAISKPAAPDPSPSALANANPASPLDVIGLSLLADRSSVDASADEVKSALDQSARQGVASLDASGAAHQWFYLERLKLGGLTGNELGAARDEARASLKSRLEKSRTPLSIDELRQVLSSAADRMRLAQTVNATIDDDGILASCGIALSGAVRTYADSLGVTAGALTQVSPQIAARDRFVIYQDVATLTEIRKDADLLGLQIPQEALLAETLAQLGRRLEAALREELRKAEIAVDEAAFADALAEYLFVRQQDQLGVFAGANIPVLDYQELGARFGRVHNAAAKIPRPPRALAKQFHEVDRIGRILESVPPNVSFPAEPIQRAYTSLQTALTTSFSFLSTATREELLAMLLAGNAAARVRDAMNFNAGSPVWEDSTRLSALDDKLAAKCQTEDDPITAFAAAQSLFGAAARKTNDLPARKLYLLEAQKFVGTLRTIALARQNAAPLNAAESILAGGIAIDEIAGGLTYNTKKRELTGWASGKMRLPGMGASFTLARADFNTGGAFSVSAFGSVDLPGSDGSGKVARLSVTPRHPATFAYDPINGLSVAGGGKVEVNGASFEAWFSIDDPNYRFGAAFSCLNFDLADKLKVMVPTWPNATRFPAAVVRDVNEYVRDFGNSLEELGVAATTPPSFREAGSPPRFEPPFGGAPFAGLSAWASAEISDAALQLKSDYSTSANAAVLQLENIKARFDKAQASEMCDKDLGINEAIQATLVKDKLQKALAIKKRKIPAEPVTELEAKLNEVDAGEANYLLCLFRSQQRHPLDLETAALRLLNQRIQLVNNRIEVPDIWQPVFAAEMNYHKRTFAEILTESGLDGNGFITGAKISVLSEDELFALVDNFLMRLNISALANDDAVTHVPNGSTQTIGTRALVNLMLQRRENLVREAWEVQNTMPAWPVRGPLAMVSVDEFHANAIREHATRARELLLKWLEFLVIFQRFGLDAEVGGRIVLQLDGSRRAWDPSEDIEIGNAGLSQLLAAEQTAGIPVASVYARLYDGTMRMMTTYPIMEGLYGLTKPIGSYSLQQRNRIDQLGLQRESLDDKPPEYQALWRRYQLAKQKVVGLSTHDQMFSLADQLEYEVKSYILGPAEKRVLTDGLNLARKLRTLTLAAELSGLSDVASRFQGLITLMDAPFKTAARAQKAWWYVAEYTDIFIEGADAYIANTATASRQFFSDTASESARTSVALLKDLTLLFPTQRPVDLALPGDVRIDNVFGEVRYNAETNGISSSFGGTLSFPNIDAKFSIVHLDLDNSGKISIEASAAGPLPGASAARLNGTLAMAGKFQLGAPGQLPVILENFATSGQGTLSLPDNVSFNAQFSYDTATRVLDMRGSANHIDLKLSDHFVLLDGVGGARFGGVGPDAFPSSGRFELGGTFGILRKTTPTQTPAAGGTPSPLTPADFHLSAIEAVARLDIQNDRIAISLPHGKLVLPEMFESEPVPPATQPTRAQIAINEAQPPTIALALGAPDNNGLRPINTVTFSGGITFANLGLKIPNFKDAGARQFEGAFDFGSVTLNAHGAIDAAQAPKLTIDNGFVFIPHPIDPARIEVQASNIEWKLDGFPVGKLRLATDVSLLNLDIFNLAIVGAPNSDLTGIEILAPEPNATLPSVRLFGTMRAVIDNTIIDRDPSQTALQGIPVGKFGATVSGQLLIHAPVGNNLPAIQFHLGDLTVTGDFRVGGANGVHVYGLSQGEPAKIIFSGLDNIFNLADQDGRRFVVSLTGKIKQANLPGFGMGDARIEFFDRHQPPRFIAPNVLVYDGTDWDLAKILPVELREARLEFHDRTLPITELMKPSNLIITSTFRMGFPTLAKQVIGGGADNVRITFLEDGTPQLQNLEGIELTLDPGLEMPPIKDIGGTIYLTGFSNPFNLMMAGRVGGTIQTYSLNFVLAATASGPLGIALDVNAGSAGIPLPYGFMFTGAGAGISFLNTSADPMDIHSYLEEVSGRFRASQANPPPPATMSWDGFKNWRDKLLAQIPTFPPIGSGPTLEVIGPGNFPANDPIGCPVDIPPASANIFGMPHPDKQLYPKRFILKFSSIPEAKLNKPITEGGLGITEDSIAAIGKSGTNLALAIAQQIRLAIEQNIPPVPPQLGPGAQQAATEWLDALEQGFANILKPELIALGVNATSKQLYDAIKTKAYAGVPIQDATISFKGVFTHQAISMFMNVDGGGTIGTTGSAGVAGHVNFMGLPVGTAELYLSVTDVNGNPNPQLTGDITMALGPLELGAVKGALKAEGAVTGIAAVALQIAETLAPDVRARIMAAIDPKFVGKSLAEAQEIVADSVPLEQRATAVSMLMTGFMAQVLRQPPGTLSDTLLGQIASLFDQVNPELVICAESTVKFAGLKLSNGLASMKFRMRKTGREAYFEVAPMGFIGYGTPITLLTSGIDRAAVSYAETFPDVTGLMKRLLNGRLSSPEALAEEARNQVAIMLENSTMTGSYEVSPLGMNLARAQMRLINPDLTTHPVVRNNNNDPTDNWIAPGTGALAALPAREKLLLQSVRKNVLADVFWKGNGSNLPDLYDGSIPALQGRSLTHDYFPHGGVAMAAMLDVPRIFTTLPRAEWATLIDASKAPLARLQALRTIMHDYFGTTVQQGNFMAYVPFPNPPALFNQNGTPIVPPPSMHPADLVESLKTFDPTKANLPQSLWELDKSFAYLNLNGQLIDIPIGEVDMAAYGPDVNTGAPARFAGKVKFPNNSWAALLYGAIDLDASVTGQARANRRTIAQALAALQSLDTLGATPADSAILTALPQLISATADTIAQDFPRVEVRANMASFHPPAEWNWPQISPQGTFNFYAYSPEFASTLPNNPTPLQSLQKTGGVAMEGSYNLAGIARVDGQMLIEPPTPTRQRPRMVGSLTGKTATLPFGALDNASIQFDTESATFLTINGALRTTLDLQPQTGWPIQINAGANVSINNHNAIFTFTSNGATAIVTADYTDPTHPVFSIGGDIAFNSLVTDLISIVPQVGTGAKLIVDLNAPGPRLMNGRVVIGGLFNQAADLPAIAVDNALNFVANSINTLPSAIVTGFTIDNLGWKVQRTAGVLSISSPSGALRLKAFGNNFTVPIGGTITSSGGFTLNASTSLIPLSGLPVDQITGAAITFQDGAVNVVGSVSGGLLNTLILPGISTVSNVRLTLNPTAVTDLLGRTNVSSIVLGFFKIKPPSGSSLFEATLRLNGIEMPAGQIYHDLVSASVPIVATPGFMIPSLSAPLPTTIWNASGLNGSIAGFNLNNLNFSLVRIGAAPVEYQMKNIGFQAPLPTGFPGPNFTVAGGTIDSVANLVDLPITTLPPLAVGRFAFQNPSGTPKLSTTGINLPSARLSCVDLWPGLLSFPTASLTIPSAGNLSIPNFTAGNITPALGSLNGFTLSGAHFDVVKSGAIMTLNNFGAALPIPGFIGNTVTLSATTIPSSGIITLTGSPIPQLGIDKIVIKGASGGSLLNTLTSDKGWVFKAGMLDVANLFSPAANLSSIVDLTVPANSAADATFATFNFAPSLRGYTFGSSNAKLERVAGATRLNFTGGAMPLPGGPTLGMNGTISSLGVVNMSASLNNGDFYGFPISGSLALSNNATPWITVVSATSPRAWWKMDEKGGLLTLNDTIGALDGATPGPSTLPLQLEPSGFRDGSGVSMRFDGVDDYFSIPDNAALEGGSSMSVAAWFKVNQFPVGKAYLTIVSKGDDSWRIAQDGSGDSISFDSNSATSQNLLPASTVNVNDGRWHHVVATYDGATKRLYIDGVLRASADWTGPIRDSSYPVMIGANAQQAGRNWNGWIDEVIFWNRSIEPSEVQALYSRPNGLDLTFNAQVNLKGTGAITLQPFRPTFGGSINTAGEFDFFSNDISATLLGFGFTDIDLEFSRKLLPSSTATIKGAATLNALTQTPFNINPRFSAQFTSSAGVTTATLSALDQTINLGGYAPGGSGFDLTASGSLGTSTPISFSDFRFGNGVLSAVGLPPLGGTILTSGAFAITSPFTDDITLSGFRAPSAVIDFVNSGLTVSGNFGLNATVSGFTRNFGNVTLGGRLNADGTYTLTGNGSLQIGAYSTTPIDLKLDSSTRQVSALTTPNVNFGALVMPLQNFSMRSDDFKGVMNKTFSKGPNNSLQDFTGTYHLQTSFSGLITLNFNFNSGALEGRIGGTWNWAVINFGVPNGYLPNGSFTVGGGIGDNGFFVVNNSSADGNDFMAPFWMVGGVFAPPPGWPGGHLTSEDFDLW